MTFDLAFTTDPVWIEERNKVWEECKDLFISGISKKQVQAIKKYFFTGLYNKKSYLPPAGLVIWFPAYSVEAMEYVFQNHLNADKIPEGRLQGIVSSFFQTLDQWPGAAYDEKIKLFQMVFGEAYSPSIKFPFLIGQEKNLRNFPYSPLTLFRRMAGIIQTGCRGDDPSNHMWPLYIDYIFSLLPHVNDVWVYSFDLKEKQLMSRLEGPRVESYGSQLSKMMAEILQPKDWVLKQAYFPEIRLLLDKLITQFDELKQPIEIVERWKRVKEAF